MKLKFEKIEKNNWSRFVEYSAIIQPVMFASYTVVSLCTHTFHIAFCLTFLANALLCILAHLYLEKMRNKSNEVLEKLVNDFNESVEQYENQKEEK